MDMLLVRVQLLSHVQLFVTPWTIALPSDSVHGVFKARILEWVAISFSRGSSQPRDQTHVSCMGRWILLPLKHLGSPYVTGGFIFYRFYNLNATLKWMSCVSNQRHPRRSWRSSHVTGDFRPQAVEQGEPECICMVSFCREFKFGTRAPHPCREIAPTTKGIHFKLVFEGNRDGSEITWICFIVLFLLQRSQWCHMGFGSRDRAVRQIFRLSSRGCTFWLATSMWFGFLVAFNRLCVSYYDWFLNLCVLECLCYWMLL